MEFVIAIVDIVLGALAETKRINLYRLISSATRNFHLPRPPTVALLFSSLSSLIYSRSRSFCVAKMIHPSRQAYVEEAEVSKLPLLFEPFKALVPSTSFCSNPRNWRILHGAYARACIGNQTNRCGIFRTLIWESISPTFVSDDPQLFLITSANRANSY